MTTTAKRFAGLAAVGIVSVLLACNEWRIAAHPDTAKLVADSGLDSLPFYRLQVWLAAIGTLAVYSFMFKENPLSRMFEHALLGCATGYGCAVVVRQVLIEQWAAPIYDGLQACWTKGFSPDAFSNVILIVPGIIGLLWYFQYSKRHFWISRIAMCITLGAGAGLAFKGIFNQLIPQITGTFKSFWPNDYLMPGATILQRACAGFENLVFVTGTVSVLSYFFFAFGRKGRVTRGSATLGRWFLMISLGAFFGNTFMTRLSVLIERVHFLISEWLRFTQM